MLLGRDEKRHHEQVFKTGDLNHLGGSQRMRCNDASRYLFVLVKMASWVNWERSNIF